MDWEARYQADDTPWDLGDAPPVLKTLAASLGRSRVLCPGVGRGLDAIAWAAAGHEVTGVDIAPSAIAAAAARDEHDAVEWLEADALALAERFAGTFDLVWEQTFLCAINPLQRDAYIDQIHDVLKPGGQVIALLWNHGNAGGPPYDLPPQLARDLFQRRFAVTGLEPVESGTRQGEYLLRARRA